MAKSSDECLAFIREIRMRPTLWDQNDPDYHNRDVSERFWEEIGHKFSSTVDHLKTKWTGLRSQFRKAFIRQLKFHRAHPGAKVIEHWKYFVPLLFLKNQMKQYKPKVLRVLPEIHMGVDCDDIIVNGMMKEFETLESNYEEPEIFEMKPVDLYPDVTGYSEQKTKLKPSEALDQLLESFQRDIIALEKEKIATIDTSQTDEDLLFLHSLLPYLKSLDKTKKFVLRTKIQKLICDYIMDIDDDTFNTAFKKPEKKSKDVQVQMDKEVETKEEMQLNSAMQPEIEILYETSEGIIPVEDLGLSDETGLINIDDTSLRVLKEDQCIWLLNIDD